MQVMHHTVTEQQVTAGRAKIMRSWSWKTNALEMFEIFSFPNAASVLVKTREGRPIKIEGNKYSSVTKGGVSARVQASVLSLYDNERLKGPQAGGKASTWADVDKNIKSQLEEIAVKGGQIRIVSSTILSPSTKAAIADFTRKYPTTKHVYAEITIYL